MIVCLQDPVFALRCDRCSATYTPDEGMARRFGGNILRGEAKSDGWSVAPPSGKGSRSAPDLCEPCKQVPNATENFRRIQTRGDSA